MNANAISSQRLKNLFRYEWAIDKRFYLLGTVGIFMISFGVFLTIWFNQYSGYVWKSTDYNSIFFGGFVFLSVFGISQSFIDLRDKSIAIRYLTLPASTTEKFLVQVCMRLVLPLIRLLDSFWDDYFTSCADVYGRNCFWKVGFYSYASCSSNFSTSYVWKFLWFELACRCKRFWCGR